MVSLRASLIRTSFLASDKKRDAGKKAPAGIERICDIPYGSDAVWQLMDLYRPEKCEDKKLPVIVSIHGGGWVYGSKAIYQFYCMDLAKRGFAVLNFTYRLAPEYRFPAALEDTNLVMKWILQNAEAYGLDTDNIFAVGDSAGGNYLGLYAAFLTNPQYAERFEFQAPEGLRMKGVGMNCGYYDAAGRLGKKDGLLREALGRNGKYGYEDMDVISKITSEFPPAYIMTANQDFLIRQAPLLKETLDRVGVVNEYKVYGSEEQPLGHVFHVDVPSPAADLCNDEETAFFRSFIEKTV